MRSVSTLLIVAISVFATPGAADGQRTSDVAIAIGPIDATPTRFGASEGRDSFEFERSRGWPPTSLEIFLTQNSNEVPDQPAPNRSPVDLEISRLQKEHAEIDTRGPRIAKIVGIVMTSAGAFVGISAGAACAYAESSYSTECNKTNAAAIGGAGGAVALVGLVTLISGATTLNRRGNEKDELEHKIQKLRREGSPALENFDARLQIGETMKLSLSWSF